MDKFIKHTVPDSRWDTQSVFADPSTSAYAGYVVNSALSGSVQIDKRGRRNIIWVAGDTVGFNYSSGRLSHPENAVKVVLSTDSGKIHAYPQSSTKFQLAQCADCGKHAVY